MFLKRGILVNWGNIPQLEFDFGPINLFSGGNGSGKTTAADAIQSLMTAAHENLFNYNPGQDETTQRGRGGKQVRTLASYVLGCDDGSYARPWATDCYVAGIFHPTQGEAGEAFTAVMCIRAHLDNAGKQKQARQDDLQFLIVPGEQLSLSHFVRSYKDGKHVVPITDIATLLKKEFGSKSIEQYDKKGAYLRRLYGGLRGRRDAVSDREAKHAARTFANFMAYKPVKSINDFVAKEVLEPKDLGDAIRNVSDLMKTIHKMEQDTRFLCETVATLGNAQALSQAYVTGWTDWRLGQYSEASRQLLNEQQAYLAAKKAQKANIEAMTANEQQSNLCNQRRQQLHAEIVAMEAQRQGITALKTKDELDATIKRCSSQLVAQARPLLEQDRQLTCNVESTEKLLAALNKCSIGTEIPELDSSEFRQLAKSIRDGGATTGIDIQQLLAKDWIDIAPLEHSLDQLVKTEALQRRWVNYLHDGVHSVSAVSLRDQLFQQQTEQNNKRQKLQALYQQKQQEIKRLENHKVSYPRYVEEAIDAIQQACPEAEPRVLCDYIEVLDPQWQMAVEGYIGGARFSIIVEAAYEAEAIRVVRQLGGRQRNRAKVIQGTKAKRDAGRLSLPQNSMVDVMGFTNKTAEFYLRASYGNVIRVADAEALKHTGRGITPEGLGSGSYSMWRCDIDDAELVFGQGARERALHAKESEIAQLIERANETERHYQEVARLFELVEKIQPVSCTDVIQTMLDYHRELHQAESALERLDLSDFEQLEQQLQALQEQYQQLEIQAKTLGEEAGGLKERERHCANEIKKLADKQEQLQQQQEQCEQLVLQIADWYTAFEPDSALQQADERAQQAGKQFDFSAENKSFSEQLEKTERALSDVLMRHNLHCNSHDAIVYDPGLDEPHGDKYFRRMVALVDEIDLIHNRLKNNVLIEKHDKLSDLKDSFNTAFVANLCHSIYQAINEGERTLKELSHELQHHRFGADRERFYFGYEWVPEFRDYWRFLKEIIEVPNLGDGVTLFDAELSEKACSVRDKLLTMLLDNDAQKAQLELGRISDYRNYRHYEIYKEPEGKEPIALSQYGTGSGGQLETPAYIIRSAAVTSAFRFNEGNTHLRMVLVDEAFSKMDETRSREVISYLTETLGLQLLFIMPTSKSGPFMDIISHQLVFSKCPTAEPVGELKTRVLVDRKACNQEKIQQLWANHRRTVRHQGMLDFMEELVE